MNPCIIRYSDLKVNQCSNITKETVSNFAYIYGLDFVDEHFEFTNEYAYSKKSELLLRELNNDRPYVIWCDSDIIFRKTLYSEFINELLVGNDMAMKMVGGAYETSFILVKNDSLVKSLIEIWASESVNSSQNDQIIFNSILNRNKQFRNMILPIGDDLISSIQDKSLGLIGVHCYRTRFRIDSVRLEMIKTSFYK